MPKASAQEIEISFDLPKDELCIHADPILLEQAISNMIKNAIESIQEDGTIRISCDSNPVSFKISDNGAGISAETESKLFTPFYSTKTTGQGVGLMLIRDILQSHQAEFSLSTDHKSGWTTFEVIMG